MGVSLVLPGNTSWGSETSAYASSYDQARQRYVGLVAGRAGAVVSEDPDSMVVKAAVALKQMEADQREASCGGAKAEEKGRREDGRAAACRDGAEAADAGKT